jgi:hypothetical protein
VLKVTSWGLLSGPARTILEEDHAIPSHQPFSAILQEADSPCHRRGAGGPGGEFVFTGGGSDWLVYHYYDAFDNGDAWIQIRPLTWVGGWPVTGQALVPVPGQSGSPAS